MKTVDYLLDTSVVVRYLIADVPKLAKRAKSIVEKSPALGISADCISETGYVLTKEYGVPRDETVAALVELLARRNLVTVDLDKLKAIQALQFCKGSGRVSFDDAVIWATARSLAISNIYTFDARFPDRGVTLLGELAQQIT